MSVKKVSKQKQKTESKPDVILEISKNPRTIKQMKLYNMFYNNAFKKTTALIPVHLVSKTNLVGCNNDFFVERKLVRISKNKMTILPEPLLDTLVKNIETTFLRNVSSFEKAGFTEQIRKKIISKLKRTRELKIVGRDKAKVNDKIWQVKLFVNKMGVNIFVVKGFNTVKQI